MSRRAEYYRYLKSPEWRNVRIHALVRSSGACEFCGSPAAQVHHVQYPKQFGREHPHSIVAVCDQCHKTAHGVQKMKELTNVERMRTFAPDHERLNYLLTEGRVYASAASWRRALAVPVCESGWFDHRLAGNAIFKKDEELECMFDKVTVYRWRCVLLALRNFDFEFRRHGYKNRPLEERRELERFHDRYEKLVEWGDDLQERAMAAALKASKKQLFAKQEPLAAISETRLAAVVAQAVAPRFDAQERREQRQDVVIQEIKQAVPALQPGEVFITVKRAIAEKGLDASIVPLHPTSNETLSGLAGQMLVARGAAKGTPEVARLDGSSRATAVNTYRRADIYAVLDEIMRSKPKPLF